MRIIPLSRAKPPFRVTYDGAHGFEIQDADDSYIGEPHGRHEGPTCSEIAARLGLGEDMAQNGRTAKRRAGLSIGVSSYALLGTGAVLMAAKIWASAPIPWWFAILPLVLLCVTAILLLVVAGGVAGLAGLGLWFARRRP